jgi:hypothetical protein
MKRLSIVSVAVVALVGSAVGLCAAESETFTGTAAYANESCRAHFRDRVSRLLTLVVQQGR